MKYKYSTCYDGKRRKLYRIRCIVCREKVYVPKHMLAERKTCSKTCEGTRRRNRIRVQCSWCSAFFERRVSKTKNKTVQFCKRACKDRAQHLDGIRSLHPPHYHSTKQYRSRALKHYGKRCANCGYSKHRRMLDVHHVDSDRSNNRLKNLQVLCVWCHALVTRGVSLKHKR